MHGNMVVFREYEIVIIQIIGIEIFVCHIRIIGCDHGVIESLVLPCE